MANGNGSNRSDTVVVATAFFALVGTMFTAFLGYKMAELSQRTAVVAEQNIITAQKLTDVSGQTSIIKNTALQTRDYVNHLMEVQLTLNAKTAKRLAEVTNTLEDKAVADRAELDLQTHLTERRQVQAKETDQALERDLMQEQRNKVTREQTIEKIAH